MTDSSRQSPPSSGASQLFRRGATTHTFDVHRAGMLRKRRRSGRATLAQVKRNRAGGGDPAGDSTAPRRSATGNSDGTARSAAPRFQPRIRVGSVLNQRLLTRHRDRWRSSGFLRLAVQARLGGGLPRRGPATRRAGRQQVCPSSLAVMVVITGKPVLERRYVRQSQRPSQTSQRPPVRFDGSSQTAGRRRRASYGSGSRSARRINSPQQHVRSAAQISVVSQRTGPRRRVRRLVIRLSLRCTHSSS